MHAFATCAARGAAPFIMLVLGSQGCEGPTAPTPTFVADEWANVPVAAQSTVVVTLSDSTLSVGQVALATAQLFTDGVESRRRKRVRWSSSDTAIVVVDGRGVVTARRSGLAGIMATVEGVVGSAAVSVENAAVSHITVTLADTVLVIGSSSTASAITYGAQGNVRGGRSVSWTPSSPNLVTVDATSGAMVAVAEGMANIVATSEGVSGSASVRIRQGEATPPSIG